MKVVFILSRKDIGIFSSAYMPELVLIKTVVSGYERKMKSGPKDAVEHLGKMEGKLKCRTKVRKTGLRLKVSS